MLIAREDERKLLKRAYEEDSSQFVAIYGRRRVGKTFLVRETFGYRFTFQHAGLSSGNLAQQLSHFVASLKDAGADVSSTPANWLQAFELLKDLIRLSHDERKVIFIDELSWMDVPRCDLMVALEAFWNGWASARRDIVLIVCASATSWMLDKVIHNRGGLYNRLTRQIALEPFTLRQCEQFAEAKGLAMNRHQVLECYMILGGVPYYWDLLERGLSLSQNVDALFYAKNAPLAREFDYLFSSLFRKPEVYLAIVSALGRKKAGMTRGEIAESIGVASSGDLTKKLAELESCGFVRRIWPYGKKQRGTLYQLIDNFTLFNFKFVEGRPRDERFWSNQTNTPARNAWCGIAFERVCFQHIAQIKQALGIAGVLTEVGSWTCKRDDERGTYGSQIDLLIARRDQVINLCEMMYSSDDFVVSSKVEEDIRHKIHDFQTMTKSKSAIHATLVTPYGLRSNRNSGVFQSVVTGDGLFA